MIETSTISSSFSRSKRKSKITTLLVAVSMLFAAVLMMTVVKYDSYATNTPAQTKIASSTNASSTKEALIISRVLQGGPPGGQTGGQQPLDEIMAYLENNVVGEMQTNILNKVVGEMQTNILNEVVGVMQTSILDSITNNHESTKQSLGVTVNNAKSEVITAVGNIETDLTTLKGKIYIY